MFISRYIRSSPWRLLGLAMATVPVWLTAACSGPTADSESVDEPESATSESMPIPFANITAAAGIDFVHRSGAGGDKLLPETMGGGVVIFDVDKDDDNDLLLVSSAPPWLTLYANDGQGQFDDVTREHDLDQTSLDALGAPTGSVAAGYAMTAIAADYDADGDVDLFLTRVGNNLLLDNQGAEAGFRFVDVTSRAGVGGGDRWSTGAGFFDVDGDGWLDLFVANYIRWSRVADLEQHYSLADGGRAYRPPFSFPGQHCQLLRNRGDGTFEDISAAAGIEILDADGLPASKALALRPTDIDDDGDLDLLVANDTTANFLLRNDGGRFVDIASAAGAAFAPQGLATGAMGVDSQWRMEEDGNAELTLAIGNFADEATSLLVLRRRSTRGPAPTPPLFEDLALARLLAGDTRDSLTFGLLLFDADLDGTAELLQVNGHIEPEIADAEPGQSYAQPAQLFRLQQMNPYREGRPRYRLLGTDQVGDLTGPWVGRGAAYGDLDGDGDLDLVITQIDRRPAVLRNDQAAGHHWLRLRLRGMAPNLDAIGAHVEVFAGGQRRRQEAIPVRSYLSQVEPILTFGLGTAEHIDHVEIRWPGGQISMLRDIAVDQTLEVSQAAGSS